MSTEQKPPPAQTPAVPHHKEHLETNALGKTLVSSWEKFKAGQLISYKWMGITLIAVTAILLTWYILSERQKEGSRRWVELESANSRTALEDFAKQNPDTLVGNVAQLDLARVLLGPDGIERLPTVRDDAERKAAVGNIEKSRELLTKLLDAFKDQPLLKVQCLVGLAKAEATLVGMFKEGSLTESLGSVDKLIEWLDKIGEAADGTPWGDDAKKMSASLKSGPDVKAELLEVQKRLYTPDRGLPGFEPIAPGKNPLERIPGFPGPSSITPTPKPEPGPKPPDPKPPEPGPKPPDPKAPEPPKKTTEPTPKAPDPKAPEPPKKGPEPAPPPKAPDPKPPEPPKK